jgi:outer membrane protein assembly factor BamB
MSFDGRNGVAVLNLRDGKELWSARPAAQLVGFFGASPGRDVVVATQGTCAEVLGMQGLVAFDAATGRRRWTNTDAGYALRTTHQLATYFSAVVPIDAQGVVVTAGEHATIGLRAKDGSVAWSSSTEDDAPLGVSEDLVFTVHRQSEAVDSFRALDRRTGKVRWTAGGWSDRFDIIAANARHVVVATGGLGSQPYTDPVTLVVLDARTGNEEGRFDAGKPKLFYFSDVALAKGLIVYADGRSIVGRRLPNGAQVWRHRFSGPRHLENMARSSDSATVFALGAGTDARVTALDAATGHHRWARSTKREGFLAAGGPAATFGRFHPSRTLIGVETSSGTPRWRYAIPPNLTPPGFGATDLTINTAAGRVAISNPCDNG